VALTPAGEAFLAEARRILAIAEAAPDLAQRVSSGVRGLVRIGFTAGPPFGILGRMINTIEQQLPEVRIETVRDGDARAGGGARAGGPRPGRRSATVRRRAI
jgi:DNA-binding transcriptional LysR family regulator